MKSGALGPYERALRHGGRLGLRSADGSQIDLDVGRWLAPADGADVSVLERCVGPVLDVGCGPGRFVEALTSRGITALGVDVAAAAIGLADRRGPALRRDVFGHLPGEGRWPTVLLIDGNIGIGGHPVRLLERLRRLLRHNGQLLVETDPDPGAEVVRRMRFVEDGRAVGEPFGWAVLGRHALNRHAAALGYEVGEEWSAGGRAFVSLVA